MFVFVLILRRIFYVAKFRTQVFTQVTCIIEICGFGTNSRKRENCDPQPVSHKNGLGLPKERGTHLFSRFGRSQNPLRVVNRQSPQETLTSTDPSLIYAYSARQDQRGNGLNWIDRLGNLDGVCAARCAKICVGGSNAGSNTESSIGENVDQDHVEGAASCSRAPADLGLICGRCYRQLDTLRAVRFGTRVGIERILVPQKRQFCGTRQIDWCRGRLLVGSSLDIRCERLARQRDLAGWRSEEVGLVQSDQEDPKSGRPVESTTRAGGGHGIEVGILSPRLSHDGNGRHEKLVFRNGGNQKEEIVSRSRGDIYVMCFNWSKLRSMLNKIIMYNYRRIDFTKNWCKKQKVNFTKFRKID